MTEQVSTESRKLETPFAAPGGFTEMGRKTFEMMADMQKGILESLLLLNRQCLAHAESDAKLTSEFMTKLATAKSIPDAASACQEYASHRMEIFADDTRQLLAAADKMVPKFLDNSFRGAGT
jgi:dihydrofolate reductase